MIHSLSTYKFEPGFHHWKQIQREKESSVGIEDPEIRSFEDAKDVIQAIVLSSENVCQGLKFLQSILQSIHCNGLLVSQLLDYFLREDVVEKLNPALDNQ